MLNNEELYLYSANKDDREEPKQVILMTPGVFVKAQREISVEGDHQKVFPVEIYLGGTYGNIGVAAPKSACDNQSGYITLFFESSDLQKQWVRLLEKVSGSYKIRDFYNFESRQAREGVIKMVPCTLEEI